ncbi:cyclopropane-fatty-acyl-phospholipid synthase family protein [Tabrizicola sp.]|uniref:SAM-dependent methyltransferase n=1 Tax=Tabrizicola sp. TaxID=2005166 RepID=UPI001A4C9CA5|nr:cyclopropane-fatty-acyl-phospholipid synthase family protein [Tabrizicola sp.]MBL9061463.1 class I SAM-dependent methyltransferase [Tabrizicola sp.]
MSWNDILAFVLRRGVRTGALELTLADGTVQHFGPGGAPDVGVTLHDPDLPRKFLMRPDLAMGEAYLDGRLTLRDDDIRSFITFALRNGKGRRLPPPLPQLAALWKRAKSWAIWNHIGVARRNVAHHYDISPELYDLFLGETKQYTCAYFRRPDMTLEEAQAAKMAHIATKLLLKPGMRVLDIGCGFGTLALTLARDHGVHVTGITLSEVQIAEARRRAWEAGLDGQVEFRLQDYRAVSESYDRVVSVGMMEHVGLPHLGAYFRKVADLMPQDGVALIHYIGRWSPPDTISPWFNKYIFPGAYCPSISEAMRVVEKTGMILSDLEVWRGHYERTLQEWLKRFDRNIGRVRQLQDDRFVRMWRYYLQSAELSFSEAHMVIHQLQLAKARGTVPMTRDYLYPARN